MMHSFLKPLSIFIENQVDYALSIDEIKYTFETLLTTAGIPWRFCSSEKSLSCDIYFGRQLFCIKHARMYLRMGAYRRASIKRPARIRTSGSLTFLHFESPEPDQLSDIDINDRNSCIFNNDIIFSTYFLLSGWEESLIPRDGKDRHEIEALSLYQSRILHTPVVNQYAHFIRDFFSTSHQFLPPWPDGKKYALVLSHDVDYPEIIPSIEVLRYIVHNKHKTQWSKITDIWAGREHFFKFSDWINLERKYGMKSAFYFCGFKGSLLGYFFRAPDPFYDIRKKIYRDMMRILNESGWEIGVHSSYFAYCSEVQFRAEKANVEMCLGSPVFGNRHHYWHMNPDNPSDTAHLHDIIGFIYDLSISFERHSGFRRSICSPFHLYNMEKKRPTTVLQIPTTLMDDQLFGYAKISGFDSYQAHIDSLLQAVRDNRGVFVADFHDRILNDTFFPGWGGSYEYLLNRVVAENDYYCDTPVNIAKYWIDREQTLRKASA